MQNRRLWGLSLLLVFVTAVLLVGILAAQELPTITINVPVAGEVLSPAQVVVAGTASGLPSNSLVVRAQDLSGGIIAEQAAIVDPLGGNWSTVLNLSRVEPGTRGQIVVFADATPNYLLVQAVVPVTFGAAQPPTPVPTPSSPELSINTPRSGEIVSMAQIVVSGVGSALPDNTVIVRALGADGVVLTENATRVNAVPGGAGPWTVVLQLSGVTPGTNGRIVAFAPGQESGNAVETSVNVTYGRADLSLTPAPTLPAPAAISISAPRAGETINTNLGLVVTGTATNILQNSIVVRVTDPAGTTLTQQAVAVSLGFWTVNLFPGRYNGPATISAFAPIPGGGMQGFASVGVNLLFGPQEPPSLAIISPADNAIADATSGRLTIIGQAFNIDSTYITVQLLDEQRRPLLERPATVDRNGNWRLLIDLLVEDGARGTVRAFARSLADRSIAVEDNVEVRFVSNCTVEQEDWFPYTIQAGDYLIGLAQRTGTTAAELAVANCLPNPSALFTGDVLYVPRNPSPLIEPGPDVVVVFEEPSQNASLDVLQAVMVTGYTEDAPEGNTLVRALDNNGDVIDEQLVEVTAETAGRHNRWGWKATLDLSSVAPGTHGILFAYTVSPVDGRVAASASHNVVYGDVDTPVFISIGSPQPYSLLPDDATFTVSGRGAGLPENNVVVQALDINGLVLAESVSIVASPDVGGEGDWETTLTVTGRWRGMIRAFSTSPADGSVIAMAEMDIRFGDLTRNERFSVITFPLPRTVITADAPFIIAVGQVGGVFEDRIYGSIINENGEFLLTRALDVDAKTGIWRVISDADIEQQGSQVFRLHVMAAAPDGTMLAADRIPVVLRVEGLTGRTWLLQSLNGEPLVADNITTAKFDSLTGTVSGWLSCNNYTGAFGYDNGSLHVGPIATTLRACVGPEGLEAQAQAFLSALQAANAYTVEDQQLTITSGSGDELIFVPAE